MQAGAALVVGGHKETRTCSEQTCLSRFVIEGQQGGKQPPCPGSTKSVGARDTVGVCLPVRVIVCNGCVRALNYPADCSLRNKYSLQGNTM